MNVTNGDLGDWLKQKPDMYLSERDEYGSLQENPNSSYAEYQKILNRYVNDRRQINKRIFGYAKGGLVKPSYYEEGGQVQVLPPLDRYHAATVDAMLRQFDRKPAEVNKLIIPNDEPNIEEKGGQVQVLPSFDRYHAATQAAMLRQFDRTPAEGNKPIKPSKSFNNIQESMTLSIGNQSFKPSDNLKEKSKNNDIFQMTPMVDFRNDKPNIEVVKRANGGPIFKPQGTDTVPAMLTPGEFVMKKSAVDRIGHATLNKMNNGASYFAEGGSVGASSNLDQAESFSKIAANFSGFITSFDSSVVNFNSSVKDFGAKVSEFASAVATMPATLTVNGEVGANVTSNAAGIITQISNVVQTMIANEIKKALTQPSMAQRAQPS
jgi:hypothetical protein